MESIGFPDLALLDINLPERSGWDFAKELNDIGEIPFIFLTAYLNDEFLNKANDFGAMGYLVKPVDTLHIVTAIEVAIAKSKKIQIMANEYDTLQKLLERDKKVSIAVGVVMMHYKTTSELALMMIRKFSRNKNLKLVDTASKIIEAAESLNSCNDFVNKISL